MIQETEEAKAIVGPLSESTSSSLLKVTVTAEQRTQENVG